MINHYIKISIFDFLHHYFLFIFEVVDLKTGKKVGANQEGELRIKFSSITKGYYNQASDDIFDEDGWLKTGDVGYYDDNYCVFIYDRIKEMFKYQSWHIIPASIEAILDEHPAVHESVVVGIPHETDGDLPTAVIVLQKDVPNVTQQEIEKFVEKNVDDRQRLRGGVKFVDSMPKTPTGKIIRRLVRQMIIDGKI